MSESAERLAVATAMWERSRDDYEKHFYFNLMSLLERPYSIYKKLEPKFTIDEIDRLLVAHTLSAELIMVNSRLMYQWGFYQPAIVVPNDVTGQPHWIALYRSLIGRLDQAEARMREGDKSAAFVEGHYSLISQLRAAVRDETPSVAIDARAQANEQWSRRRAAQGDRLAAEWRPLFERLLDLVPSDQYLAEIPSWPEFEAVMHLDDARRGAILHDLVQLSEERDRQRDIDSPVSCYFLLGQISVFARDNPSPNFSHDVWKALGRFASHLAARPVSLDDRPMAAVLMALRNWRDLCQFAMLDSAENLLSQGPAPLTRAALRQVAQRPSHCIVPGPNARTSPHEGDLWWNGAPPRIAEILAERPESPKSGLARLFGRKGL